MSGLSDRGRAPQRRTMMSRRWRADMGDHVIAMAWSPTGKHLACASVSGPVTIFDTNTGQPTVQLKGHDLGTTAVAWRHDGELLASAGQDGKARVWTMEGVEKCSVAGGAAWVEHVTWQPKQDAFVTAAGKKLRLWAIDGELKRTFEDHPATIADLAWRPMTDTLASATFGQVAIWEMNQSEPRAVLESKSSVLKLAWSPDGNHLAHGNQDAGVTFWDLEKNHELQMSGYAQKVRELAWDPTGTLLATGGSDEITVWDCTPPGPADSTPVTFAGHKGPISALAYQAKGLLLASGGQDGKLLLFQPGTFRKEVARSDTGAGVTVVQWGPGDRLLAVGNEAGGIAVYTVT